jgi:hypothetical protein
MWLGHGLMRDVRKYEIGEAVMQMVYRAVQRGVDAQPVTWGHFQGEPGAIYTCDAACDAVLNKMVVM